MIYRPEVSDISELHSLNPKCVAVDSEGHKVKGFEEDNVLLIAICDGTRVMSRVPYSGDFCTLSASSAHVAQASLYMSFS